MKYKLEVLTLFLFCSHGFGLGDTTFTFGPEKMAVGMYVPEKIERIVVWFHGGMNSNNMEKGYIAYKAALPFVNLKTTLLVSPSAHQGYNWLSKDRMLLVNQLLEKILTKYGSSKRPLVLVGVSDGCLGIIHFSLSTKLNITRRMLISSAPQLILELKDLANPALNQGEWNFFQGEQDELFPSTEVIPFLKAWKERVPRTTLYIFKNGVHDFSFYAVHAKKELNQLINLDPVHLKKQKRPGFAP